MVHALVGRHAGTRERRLDRTSELEAARSDPTEFVKHNGLLVVDEVQRAPELVLPMKEAVDRENRPGQFLLTGSARVLGLRALPDALVGRTETIELWLFAQGELDGEPDGFVDAVFDDEPRLATGGQLDRNDYFERALRGGFPEAVTRAHGRRAKFFESYVNDLVDRDVTQLAVIQRRDELGRLIRLLAARTATPLRIENVASDLGLARNTVERYVALFAEVFLIKRLGAWSSSATGRATQTRKLVFVDSGLAAHLAGFSTARLSRDVATAGESSRRSRSVNCPARRRGPASSFGSRTTAHATVRKSMPSSSTTTGASWVSRSRRRARQRSRISTTWFTYAS